MIPIVYLLFTLVVFILVLFPWWAISPNASEANVQKMNKNIALSVMLVVLYTIVIFYWYKTTSIDPTDEIQAMHRQSKANKSINAQSI